MNPIKSALVCLVAFAACSPITETHYPTISDSLGVTIVEYPTSFEAASQETWTLEAKPLTSIGDRETIFFRVSTALFQSNGHIAVANGGETEILLFDDSGQLISRAGRQGEGPGECSQLTFLSVGAADSLFAYDSRANRLSVFDQNGILERSVSFQGSGASASVEYMGVLRNGFAVGALHKRIMGQGLVRDSLEIVLFDPTGELTETLAVFPHFYTNWGPHAALSEHGPGVMPIPTALSGITSVAASGESIHVGLPDPYSLFRIETTGIQSITRQIDLPIQVSEEHINRFFDVFGDGPSNPQESELLKDASGSTALPAFGFEPLTKRVGHSAIIVADDGGVWLKPFQFPGDTSATAWPRFDSDGLYEGTVTLPPRFRATAVHGDQVLGVYMDESDAEFVLVYRLIPPP